MAAYPERTRLPDIDTLPDAALLRLPAILTLFGCGRSTWFLWIKQGHAPAPVRIGPRAVAWKAGEIRALLAGRSGTPTDPNIIAATQKRMANVRAAKITEAEKARRRAQLI